MWNLSFTFRDKYRASFFCVGIKTLLQVKQITELGFRLQREIPGVDGDTGRDTT